MHTSILPTISSPLSSYSIVPMDYFTPDNPLKTVTLSVDNKKAITSSSGLWTAGGRGRRIDFGITRGGRMKRLGSSSTLMPFSALLLAFLMIASLVGIQGGIDRALNSTLAGQVLPALGQGSSSMSPILAP